MVLSSSLCSFGVCSAVLSFFFVFFFPLVFFTTQRFDVVFVFVFDVSTFFFLLFLAVAVLFCILFRLVLSFSVFDGGAGFGGSIAGWFGLPTVSCIPFFAYSFWRCLNSARSTSSESLLLYTICQFLAY